MFVCTFENMIKAHIHTYHKINAPEFVKRVRLIYNFAARIARAFKNNILYMRSNMILLLCARVHLRAEVSLIDRARLNIS